MNAETKYALISDAVYQRGAGNMALNIQGIVPRSHLRRFHHRLLCRGMDR
jgi:hypothetical protein